VEYEDKKDKFIFLQYLQLKAKYLTTPLLQERLGEVYIFHILKLFFKLILAKVSIPKNIKNYKIQIHFV